MVKEEVTKQKQYKNGMCIMVSVETHERLTALKVHPKQPYAEVIEGLLKKKK